MMKHGLSIPFASVVGALLLGAGLAHAQPKPAGPSCSTATLFAGNPTYDGAPNDRAKPGSGIKSDLPFHFQNLVFVGNTLYSRDAGELWAIDTAAASPVQNRVAGKNPAGSNYAFTAGPCATARFGWIKGIAPLPGGSLLVVDGLANAVLKVKDPAAPGCTVEYWAGSAAPKAEFNPGAPLNPGDVDGAGAKAKFSNPGPIVTDDAGNAYVYDSDTHKVRKIANDAAHTVSTLGKKIDAPYTIRNMTRIGTKLYGIGDDSTKATVVEIDTATGATRTLIEGRSDAFPPLAPGKGATLHGITTDGTALYIAGLGYVWHLTTAGKLTHVAGNGTPYIDFPKAGYDPKAPHPALQVALPGARAAAGPDQEIGSFEFITYQKGAIYTRGGKATGYFVEKISCP